MPDWPSRQDLRGLFDPTVDAIVNLVKAQVDAVVKARNWLPMVGTGESGLSSRSSSKQLADQ
jgi:hypothetical protein